MLNSLLLIYHGTFQELFLLLFIENLLVSLLAVMMGVLLLKTLGESYTVPNKRERKYFCITVLLNTAITYFGFSLWNIGSITIDLSFSLNILLDFIFLALTMDLVIWLIHFFLHSKLMYDKVHYLSHVTKRLSPSNLFVVHPIETLLYGIAWILVLHLLTFNIYAIILYLVFNITLGIIANLGINYTSPANTINKLFISPSFRLLHHQYGESNYGYHTKIWDNVFKTVSGIYTKFAKNSL